MQLAVVEYARSVCGLDGANSEEFDAATVAPVIHLMPDQVGITDKGATMRLGAYPCVLAPETLAHRAYGQAEISERHRHRYEVNNAYRKALAENGMSLSGVSPDEHLVEMVEVPEHPYFIGCQFHPEFKSRPMDPHPLFATFITASLAYHDLKGEPLSS
jgi:CTP synthase